MFVTLHRDRHIQVLDKPEGMDAVPARDGGPSVASLTGLFPCHRLDRETSGCLAVAITAVGQRELSRAFAEGRVQKEYLAVVEGVRADAGEIDLPIGEWRRGRVSVGSGRAARTRYTVRWRAGGRVGVRLEPITGRTHQIRAHLASIGAPIVGDPTYGGPRADRLYLHAWRLVLPSIAGSPPCEVVAPPPPGFDAP